MIEIPGYMELVIGVIVTTIGWVAVTLLTKPSKAETLNSFNSLIFGEESKFNGFGMKILGFFAGVVGVYCALFSIGNFIYGKNILAFSLLAVTVICGLIIIKSFRTADLK